jgi:biopolymer transport protein ExbB/TolQ
MIIESIASIQRPVLTSAIIFVVALLLILLARLIFYFLLNQALKRYRFLKRAITKNINSKKDFLKEEDELKLVKDEIPRAHSAVKAEIKARGNSGQDGSYELMESAERQVDKEELNQMKIVDIVKPVGFWTSMILGQKLTYLIQSAQVINKRDKQGFWVSMIEAKEREAGKQHSRGR